MKTIDITLWNNDFLYDILFDLLTILNSRQSSQLCCNLYKISGCCNSTKERIILIFQSKQYLLKLGRFHRHAGIPSDYLGVMASIFVHAVRPYLQKHEQWNEDTEDAWRELFGHITRVMTHGHIHYVPSNSTSKESILGHS